MSMKKLISQKFPNLIQLKEGKAGSATQASKSCDQCEQEDQQSGNFSLDIYREHLRARQLILIGMIDDSTVEKVALQIIKWNEQDEEREVHDRLYDRRSNPITLKLHSPGGFIHSGLAIINAIVQSETPVIGYAFGDVASMGTLILSSCHARFCGQYSRIMIHSLAGQPAYGKMSEMVATADEWKKEQALLDKILIGRSRITQRQLDAVHLEKKDWYLDAQEALELGVVDHIVEMGIQVKPLKKYKPDKKKA